LLVNLAALASLWVGYICTLHVFEICARARFEPRLVNQMI
jgi:hypothetical protein